MSNADIFGYREVVRGEIRNDLVHVIKDHHRTASDAAVPSGQSIEFEFYVAQFPFKVWVTHSDDYVGTTERRTPAGDVRDHIRELGVANLPEAAVVARRRPLDILDLNGAVLEPARPDPPEDRVVPFEITLTPPNGLAPVVYVNPKRSEIDRWPQDSARIDPAYIERGKGLWTISVRNINPVSCRMEIQVQSVHALTSVRHRDIPLGLLNRISAAALQKALPTIEYHDGKILVSTPTHFLDLMGIDRSYSLGSVVAKAVDELPTFTPLSARVLSRADFLARLEARRTALVQEFQLIGLQGNLLVGRRDEAIAAYDASIGRLRGMPEMDATVCLVLEGMFTNPSIDLHVIGAVAEIDNTLPQIGLVFNEQIELTDVFTTLGISLSPALVKTLLVTAGTAVAVTALGSPVLGALTLIGGIKLYNSIDDIDLEEMLRGKLREREMKRRVAEYVKRALERITDIGANALHCRLSAGTAADGGDNLHIQYFNPSEARPPRPRGPSEDATGMVETLELARGEYGAPHARAISYARSTRSAPYVERATVLRHERPGAMPAGFDVQDDATLPRLDDHDCIAVLMMENRSYDHYFHDLSLAYPDKGYSRPPDSYRNTPPPGFKQPFSVVRNTTIGLGNSLIFVPSGRSMDPSHNYPHTKFQIGGGTEATEGSGEMKGFAVDLARISDSPQVAMSYFGMEDLPVFKALANYYPVCDRWFAALPVGTYPNRLASLQGNVPFLYNIHMDDPSLGYIEDYSIFDLFDSQGISWKFFESDIGTIRLYDRYRLNVSNVRPIEDLDRTLLSARQGGTLPRAMFIEPQFLFGNDDHPPMDVQQGQHFIRQVIGKFIEHGMLHRTLFVITYDEHGGFFDHVPPPGTPAAAQFGDPTSDSDIRGYGTVESLYPQGPEDAPTSLGVRVPSLVLSKYASARANHRVLDHTAILKTLLLHNRARVSTDQFSRFGDRVMKRGHLGQVLDLQSPRPLDYAALSAEIGYRNTWTDSLTRAMVSAGAVAMSPAHPASVLRGIARPRGRVFTG